jgi:hypothetical protein
MQEQELATLKGIAATLDYMASADKLDVKYTQEALGMLAEELYEIIEEEGG